MLRQVCFVLNSPIPLTSLCLGFCVGTIRNAMGHATEGPEDDDGDGEARPQTAEPPDDAHAI